MGIQPATKIAWKNRISAVAVVVGILLSLGQLAGITDIAEELKNAIDIAILTGLSAIFTIVTGENLNE